MIVQSEGSDREPDRVRILGKVGLVLLERSRIHSSPSLKNYSKDGFSRSG